LQLPSGRIITPDKDQANAHFFELINHQYAIKSISLISDSSGYSLVVEIIFNAGFSRFLDNCGKRVDTFVIKIGFTKEGTRVEINDTVVNGISPKYSTTQEGFENEAEILRNVWLTSQQNGYKMVCPIYTCHKIGGNDSFRNLIQQMIIYLPHHGDFLKTWIDQGNEVGIIVMEKITDSEPLNLLYKNQSRDENILSKKVQSLVSIWALVMFLALKHSIINTDLHLNNFLRNKTTDEIIMIDFGSCRIFNKIHTIDGFEQLIPGGHKYPKQIKVEDVLPIISDISHIDFMINENKKERGEPAFPDSTPLMDRRDEVYAIIGWEPSRERAIFHAISTEYNSLTTRPLGAPGHSSRDTCDEPPHKKLPFDGYKSPQGFVNGGSKRKHHDTRGKRRRKPCRRATHRRTRRHRR